MGLDFSNNMVEGRDFGNYPSFKQKRRPQMKESKQGMLTPSLGS